MAVNCRQCGAKMDKLSLFCPSCGAPAQAGGSYGQQAYPQQPPFDRPPQPPYGQPGLQQPDGRRFYRESAPVRRTGRRGVTVSAKPVARLFGIIPISLPVAIVILVVLIIVAYLLNEG